MNLGLVAGGFTLVNTTMLGAFAKATGLVSIENIIKGIEHTLNPRIAPKNVEATKKAFEETKVVTV